MNQVLPAGSDGQRVLTHPDDIASAAVLFAQRGQVAEALALLQQGLANHPTHCLLQHNLAELYRQTQQLDKALVLFTSVVKQYPKFVPAYQSLTALLKTQVMAIPTTDARRVQVVEQLAILTNNMGNALLDAGQIEPARAAYSEALQMWPDYPSALSNLSNVMRQMGEVTDAEAYARRAIALRPGFAEALNNLGSALSEQGRMEEAAQCYAEALRVNPQMEEARHNAGSGSLFMQLYRDDIATANIVAAHRAWGAAYPAPARVAAMPEPGARRRIGFISGDFREHAMMQFVIPLLQKLDRERFEIVLYANQMAGDGITNYLKSLPLTMKQIVHLSDAALCEMIAADGLHLLVDLSGHTRGNRLYALANKPAPVMAHWLGYMFTSGLPAMDYRITDPWTDPPETAAAKHTEQVMYLTRSQFIYQPKDKVQEVNALPALENGFITFGSLNNLQKLNCAVVEAWAGLLMAVPESKLILQTKLLADYGVIGRVRGLFEAFGVEAKRLDLRGSSANYLRTYHEIDIALDPFPYNGGTTSCDALWMGVPVLALAGDRSVGRMGVSILHALGMEDWVAASAKDYVARGVEHACALESLAELRSGLRTRFAQSSLRDEAGFAEDMARCFMAMTSA